MSGKHSPAFPAIDGSTAFYERGLTKREYFAGLAMQGLLASHNYEGLGLNQSRQFAEEAVRLADDLLSELSTPQP